MLSQEQIDSYHQQGYLRIPQMFSSREMDRLEESLSFITETWAETTPGWEGPWRKAYMDEKTEKKSKLVSIHDLQFYSSEWCRAVTHPGLCEAMADLLGSSVELHHSTLHTKPSETGHPFPLHQDMAFYEHSDDRYVDVLVHLDDTCHENGEIRFLEGSHKLGYLNHIREADGKACSPHLPTDRFLLANTVPVPAKRGDVVCFNINTVHGSHINQTDRPRRMVRIGYRDPDNAQIAGQSLGRPGWMVHGIRKRLPEMAPFPSELK